MKFIWFTCILCILVFVVCLVIYFGKFSGGLSNRHERFSEFGGYLSGVTSVINLILLIAISVAVYKADQSYKLQDIRKEAYGDIVKLITDFDPTTVTSEQLQVKQVLFTRFSEDLKKRYSYLFPNIEETAGLINGLEHFIGAMCALKKQAPNGDISQLSDEVRSLYFSHYYTIISGVEEFKSYFHSYLIGDIKVNTVKWVRNN